MITQFLIGEAALNIFTSTWLILNPQSMLRSNVFPPSFNTQENVEVGLLGQWWAVMILVETVFMLYGIFDPDLRMKIYIAMLCGEILIIPPSLIFCIRNKLLNSFNKMSFVFSQFFIFYGVRLYLMYEIGQGVT